MAETAHDAVERLAEWLYRNEDQAFDKRIVPWSRLASHDPARHQRIMHRAARYVRAMSPTWCCPDRAREGWECSAPCGQRCCVTEHFREPCEKFASGACKTRLPADVDQWCGNCFVSPDRATLPNPVVPTNG